MHIVIVKAVAPGGRTARPRCFGEFRTICREFRPAAAARAAYFKQFDFCRSIYLLSFKSLFCR